MERVSVFVRESVQDQNWTQHFALLPRVPKVGEFIRSEEDSYLEPPWYRVEQVLHIPNDALIEEEEVWSAMVFAVRNRPAVTEVNLLSEKQVRNKPTAPEVRTSTVSLSSLSPWSSYALAAIGVLLAVLINGAALRYVDTYFCFFLFIVFIAVITALRGWKPGAFGALLATVAVLFFFVDPIYTFSIARGEDGFRFGCFSLAIFVTCYAAYRSRQCGGKRVVL